MTLDHLRAAAAQRDAAGLRRTLRPRAPQDDVLDLASNDYLGLARDDRMTAAAAGAARLWGAGSTGSRLVTGTTELHVALEDALAGFVGTPAALVFSSGYLANLAVVSALAGPDATVVSDAGNHASIIDGCRLSRSTIVVTEHRDVDAVDKALRGRITERAVVVTDAVFSVDGEAAPLADLHRVAREQGALLVVDEAHALGVLGDGGRGAAAAAGVAGEPDVALTVTLSKSLGSQGGAVLGAPEVVEHLVNTARPFIFDTGLAPASAGAALCALEILRGSPSLAADVRRHAHELADAARALGEPSAPTSAVVSVPMASPQVAVATAAQLLADGVRVGCFRPPSVPDGVSRLRLTARADLTVSDLERAAAAFAGVAGAVSG